MMTRRVSILLLGVGFLVAMHNEGFSQFGRRGGFGRGGNFSSPLMLINNEAVQKDLELNDEQTKKVASLSEEMRSEGQTVFREAAEGLGDIQSLSEEERNSKMMAAMAEGTKKINEKFAPKLAEILEPEQNERLKQISWQVAGPQAYREPEVIKALGISKDQQEKIASLAEDNQKKTMELFSGGGGAEGFEKIRELRDELATQSKDVLSVEQQDTFEKLKGKPFDTASLFGGGRRRRGDRGEGREGGRRRPAAEGSTEEK